MSSTTAPPKKPAKLPLAPPTQLRQFLTTKTLPSIPIRTSSKPKSSSTSSPNSRLKPHSKSTPDLSLHLHSQKQPQPHPPNTPPKEPNLKQDLASEIQSLRKENNQLAWERDDWYQRIQVLKEQNRRMEEENEMMRQALVKSREQERKERGNLGLRSDWGVW